MLRDECTEFVTDHPFASAADFFMAGALAGLRDAVEEFESACDGTDWKSGDVQKRIDALKARIERLEEADAPK